MKTLLQQLRAIKVRATQLESEVRERLKRSRLLLVFSKPTDVWPFVRFGGDRLALTMVDDGGTMHPDVRVLSIENALGRRVDYDRHSWTTLPAPAAQKLVQWCEATEAAAAPLIAIPFGQSPLVRDLELRLPSMCVMSPPLHLYQFLSHKPSFESLLRRRGIPCVPWENRFGFEVAVSSHEPASRLIRYSEGTGGTGHAFLSSATILPQASAQLISVGPYVEHDLSINVSACVFPDGSVALYPPSIQLIGLETCTSQRFGYCGNDFFPVRYLARSSLEEMERIVREVGDLLADLGYKGLFGLDLLRTPSGLVVSEINPRFQASTVLTSAILMRLGEPDPVTDHLAAYLSIRPSAPRRPFLEVCQAFEGFSQLFVYSSGTSHGSTENAPSSNLVTGPDSRAVVDLPVVPTSARDLNCLLARVVYDTPVLDTGAKLLPDIPPDIIALRRQLEPVFPSR